MRKFVLSIILFLTTIFSFAQTFFDTADDDGIISLSASGNTQIKVNLSSTAIKYSYNQIYGAAVDKIRGVFNAELSAKPNDDGVAILMKEGKMQPGLKGVISGGIRFTEKILGGSWKALDINFKTEYKLNNYSIYDTLRISEGNDPLYEKKKNSISANIVVNYAMSIGSNANFFLGSQVGINASNNGEDLSTGSIQTITSYVGHDNQYLLSDTKQVKIGNLEDLTKAPLKFDAIFDPGLPLGTIGPSTTKLAIFTYYRTDLKTSTVKQRAGFGLCLLSQQDPSKIFSTFGYELPKFGKNIEKDTEDKGIVFLSIGYTII